MGIVENGNYSIHLGETIRGYVVTCLLAPPSVGVVWVGWDEETPLEVFPSLLWVWVGGGLTNRGIT